MQSAPSLVPGTLPRVCNKAHSLSLQLSGLCLTISLRVCFVSPTGTTGAALVRVRLPDGSNAQRSFPPGATVGSIFDFVDSLDATNYWAYSLVGADLKCL